MGPQDEVQYGHRTVEKWVKTARAGRLALADFQRSFVWEPVRAARYMKAILSGRPIGLYLILNSSSSPQFMARTFSELKTPLSAVKELVLDGQQRLTSLLHVLYGHPTCRFFIEVENFSSETLKSTDVVAFSSNSPEARAHPVESYRNHRIPMDVLRRPDQGTQGLSPLSQWCSKVGDCVDDIEGFEDFLQFFEKIRGFVDECFFQRKIHACWLPASTTRAEATEIFVETNTSSVRIKAFDEQVARVRGDNHDFRKAVEKAYGSSEVLRHYFPSDPEKWIPKIGEWMLKVSCLHAGLPPRKGNYEPAANHLFGNSENKESPLPENLDGLLEDLDWALQRVSEMGSPTVSMLPSWPPVHVMAALRSQYEEIMDSMEVNDARLLIDAYYWRSLFSNRYMAQANDRLHEDYNDLKKVLDEQGDRAVDLRVFSNRHHRLFDDNYLLVNAGWIGSNRLGKALVSAVMAAEPRPVDWVTGERLGAKTVRQLEKLKRLDRHHVFPRDVLLAEGLSKEEADNSLNAVILDRRTNRKFWKYPPHEYLEAVSKERGIRSSELRARIGGHFVPFDAIKNAKGTVRERYQAFLVKRAKMLAKKIKELAAPPN